MSTEINSPTKPVESPIRDRSDALGVRRSIIVGSVDKEFSVRSGSIGPKVYTKARNASQMMIRLTDPSQLGEVETKHTKSLRVTIARLESCLCQKERQINELSNQLQTAQTKL